MGLKDTSNHTDIPLFVFSFVMFFILCLSILFGIMIYEDQKSEKWINGGEAQKTQIESRADYIANEINYMRDKRTGVCFGYFLLSGYGTFSMTEVPCKKVQNLLPDNQRVK